MASEALRRRGSLTIWVGPAMSREAAATGRRGRQRSCSGTAIRTCLAMSWGAPETIRGIVSALFGIALRQTTGFVGSPLRLVGLDRAVPGVRTLSCRQSEMEPWPRRGRASPSNTGRERPLPRLRGPLHRPVDSTGIKVEGDGA